ERLSARGPRAVGRFDTARAVEQLHLVVLAGDGVGRRGRPARPVDERETAVGTEEEAETDVAGRGAAVLGGAGVALAAQSSGPGTSSRRPPGSRRSASGTSASRP